LFEASQRCEAIEEIDDIAGVCSCPERRRRPAAPPFSAPAESSFRGNRPPALPQLCGPEARSDRSRRLPAARVGPPPRSGRPPGLCRSWSL